MSLTPEGSRLLSDGLNEAAERILRRRYGYVRPVQDESSDGVTDSAKKVVPVPSPN
jgi:hypothetical protein